MINASQIDDLLNTGATVFDADGEKIGSLGRIYLDDLTGEPSWLTVNTGLFGLSESFVPLDASYVEGDQIRVAYSKDQVKAAPTIDPERHLDVGEEQQLYAHYGRPYDTFGTDYPAGAPDAVAGEAEIGVADPEDILTADVVPGLGPVEEEVVVEETLVSEETVPSPGRVRLRRYVATANAPLAEEDLPVTYDPVADQGLSSEAHYEEVIDDEPRP